MHVCIHASLVKEGGMLFDEMHCVYTTILVCSLYLGMREILASYSLCFARFYVLAIFCYSIILRNGSRSLYKLFVTSFGMNIPKHPISVNLGLRPSPPMSEVSWRGVKRRLLNIYQTFVRGLYSSPLEIVL